jgi:tetratricopeptide (TPR) repeat protein
MELFLKSKKNYPWILLVLAVSVLAYIPVFFNGFTNWDDHFYVTQNHLIKSISLKNIYYWVTKPHTGLYHPMVLFSLAIDYSIGGLNPRIFILHNVLLHLINTWFVFYLVKMLFNNRLLAFFTMALFGVHTLHVESVAWISERKDVLFTFYFLGSLILYGRHVIEKKNRFLVFSLFLFVFALLSKAAAVTLPLCMMLVDYFLGKRTFDNKELWNKMPFFILSMIMGLLTVYSHFYYGALDNTTGYSFASRMLISSKGFALYLINAILPLKLSAYYPMPALVDGSVPSAIMLYLMAYVLFFVALYFAFRKSRVVFFGLAFFFINLVLFLIPAGVPIIAADRFMYLPILGLHIVISYSFIQLISKYKKLKIAVFSVFGIYILLLTALTYNRTQVWKNSVTLWDDVIEKTGENWFPLLKRGRAHLNVENMDQAFADFNQSISLKPDYSISYENRGYIYLLRKDYDNAIYDFKRSISINSKSIYAYKSLGFAYLDLKDFDRALMNLNKAISIHPRYADAFKLRGKLRIETGQYEEACKDIKWAVRLGLSKDDKDELTALYKEFCEQSN